MSLEERLDELEQRVETIEDALIDRVRTVSEDDLASVDTEISLEESEEEPEAEEIVVEDDAEPVEAEADEPEVCGADLNDGGTCDRPADECPYHGDD